MTKDSFCSYCGNKFSANTYPKACDSCKSITFVNPLPVVVVLLPIKNEDRLGILTIRRSIPPFVGSLALPGGYLDVNETWQEGASRELFEETGIQVDPKEMQECGLETAPSNSNLLVFCGPPPLDIKDLPTFVPNNEVSETFITYEPIELAFPTHTQYIKKFFHYKEI